MTLVGRHEMQVYGALRPTPIALAAEVRQDSAHLLNGILADTMILYHLYKKHHWLVAGPTFYQLHLLMRSFLIPSLLRRLRIRRVWH